MSSALKYRELPDPLQTSQLFSAGLSTLNQPMDIQKELEAKFDELFGPIDDSDE